MLGWIKGVMGAKSARVAAAEPAPAPEPAWVSFEAPVADFSAIEAEGKAWVEWSPGELSCVATASAADREAGRVKVEISRGVLTVWVDPACEFPARVKASSRALSRMECAKEASGVAHGIEADIFDARVEDGPGMLLYGRVVAARLDVRGVGSILADQLKAHTVEARMRAAGKIEAWADAVGRASIDGGGEIVVYGRPAIAEIERLGNGRAKVGHKMAAGEPEGAEGIFGQMPLPRE